MPNTDAITRNVNKATPWQSLAQTIVMETILSPKVSWSVKYFKACLAWQSRSYTQNLKVLKIPDSTPTGRGARVWSLTTESQTLWEEALVGSGAYDPEEVIRVQ
jgi:hypothetical protein